MKVCIIGVVPGSLINFRGDLIKSFISNGHEVFAMASNATQKEIENIEYLGAQYINYKVQRNGLNPIADFRTLLNFLSTFKSLKPDVILSYTIKPIIWGGIAALFCKKTSFYALVTGLGFAFQKGGVKRNVLTSIVKTLYKLALSKSSGVVFQNPDNQLVFIENKIIDKDKTYRVFGSGVRLDHFQEAEFPRGNPVFLTIGRLLGDKGFREYAEAASIVKLKFPDAKFQLVGPEDPSPDAISIKEVKSWHAKGSIHYLGSTSDVRSFINNCHVFVLPSYHEGMPRTVLEAMSIGRPILTTDVEGCGETVVEGVNGYLVPKANVLPLAERMMWFIENRDQWEKMGSESRKMAEDKFDVHKVNDELLNIMGLKE